MNWKDRIARGLANLAIKAGYSTETFDTMNHSQIAKMFGEATATGKTVTTSSAMKVSAAWVCMKIISEALGASGYGVYRKLPNDAGFELADDHPLNDVLGISPNADQTDVEFRESIGLSLCQQGNSYNYIERIGARIAALTPLMNVKPTRKQGGNSKLAIPDGTIFYQVLDRGVWEDYPQEKIWHIKGFGSIDPLMGLSPIGAAREAIGSAMAMEEFNNKFFAQGGKPSGTITIDKWLDEKQRVVARENLTQLLGGLANMHKFVLLEGGMKPEPWGDNLLKDMEFVLGRRFTVEDICRFYRVPLHLAISQMEKGGYSSLEQLSLEFIGYTLRPYFKRVSASARRWLLAPGADRTQYCIRFDYDDLLIADTAALGEFLAKQTGNGVMNRNEARKKLGLNRVDAAGMDDYTVQIALTPIDKLGDLADANIESRNNPKPGFGVQPAPQNAPPEPKQQPILLYVAPAITLPSISLGAPVVQVDGAKISMPPIDFSKMPAPVINTTVESLKLPAGFKIELPGLADAFKGALALSAGLSEGTRKALEQVSLDLRKPRKAIFDKDGNPIGTEIDDKE